MRFRVALVILILLHPRLAAAETRFLSGMDDVPLMAELEEDLQAGIVFDKPAGRIVEAAAGGPVSPDEVAAFYRRTLPALGWETAADGARKDRHTLHFRREDEILTIRLAPEDGRTTVHFSLAPAPAMQ